MAARDSQGLQAIVITLAILVLGLGVGLIFVHKAKTKAQAQAQDASKNRDEARNALGNAQTEANQYKVWIGFKASDNLETLGKLIEGERDGNGKLIREGDFDRYGKTFGEDMRFYRTILESIYEENSKLAQGETAAKVQVKSLEERILAIEKQKEEQIAQANTTLKQAEQDAASEYIKFEKQRAEITSEKNEIAGQLDKQRRKFDQQRAAHETVTKEQSKQIAKLERSIEVLRSGQAEKDIFAQPSDGRITFVNQRYKKVWLDLGKADHLRPQTVFTVYGADENDALSAEQKGTIEVIRILDNHLAEARITSDDFKRPLMRGDQIYSQVWDRGRQVGFALTGMIDMDNDGIDDIDLLRRVIAINGGRVDATPNAENGKMDGQMTVDTRFLVLGKHSEDPRHVGLRKAWGEMNKEADTLGIETILLDDFLRLLGWVPDSKMVKLGTGAKPEDFKPRFKEGVQPITPTSGSDLFQRRTPPPSF